MGGEIFKTLFFQIICKALQGAVSLFLFSIVVTQLPFWIFQIYGSRCLIFFFNFQIHLCATEETKKLNDIENEPT